MLLLESQQGMCFSWIFGFNVLINDLLTLSFGF